MKQTDIKVGWVYLGRRVKQQHRKVLEMYYGDFPPFWQKKWGVPDAKFWLQCETIFGPNKGRVSWVTLKHFANKWAKKPLYQWEAYKGLK